MIKYVIQVPYISAGLKRTYHKNIEIFEYDSNIPITIRHYRTKSGKWKTNSEDGTLYNPGVVKAPLVSINTAIKANNMQDSIFYAFNTFEEAVFVKLYLINKLRNKYLDKLSELKATMEKNCPNVSDELNTLEQQHPEYFL